MRRLSLLPADLRMLESLPTRSFRLVVIALFDLLNGPRPEYAKKLGKSPYSQIVVGGIRVIYRVDKNEVRVIACSERFDSPKQFSKKTK